MLLFICICTSSLALHMWSIWKVACDISNWYPEVGPKWATWGSCDSQEIKFVFFLKFYSFPLYSLFFSLLLNYSKFSNVQHTIKVCIVTCTEKQFLVLQCPSLVPSSTNKQDHYIKDEQINKQSIFKQKVKRISKIKIVQSKGEAGFK